MAPGFQRLVRPLETRGIMKVSLWQVGLPAGRAGRTISSLTSFPLVCVCVGGGSEKEQGGEKAFKEDSAEKKADTPSPWISDCFSGEVSHHTL